MKYLHWSAVAILILVMGYLSGFGLFADGGLAGTTGTILIFLAGSAGVGALVPRRWLLSGLCAWGAVLFTVFEVSFRIGREPIPGQQPIAQVLLLGLGAVGLALFGGYVGYRLRTRK